MPSRKKPLVSPPVFITLTPVVRHFGIFAIYADGTITLHDGSRLADYLAERLARTPQNLDEDVACIESAIADYKVAEEIAQAVARSFSHKEPRFPLAEVRA